MTNASCSPGLSLLKYSCRLGTAVVFGALAMRMSEKQRHAGERERARKEMSADSPKAEFQYNITIPAANVEPRIHSTRRSPGMAHGFRRSEDNTLATRPVEVIRATTPTAEPRDRGDRESIQHERARS
jgi:hypothetical protein